MPVFQVIRKSDAAEVYRYASTQPIEWQGMEFATHDHVEIPETPAEPAPPTTVYGGLRILTKREFRLLLTFDERVRLDKFEAGFEGMAGIQEGTKDVIRTYFRDYNLADSINLDDADVTASLDLMLTMSILLDPARKTEILNG